MVDSGTALVLYFNHILGVENGSSDNSAQTWDEHSATYIG